MGKRGRRRAREERARGTEAVDDGVIHHDLRAGDPDSSYLPDIGVYLLGLDSGRTAFFGHVTESLWDVRSVVVVSPTRGAARRLELRPGEPALAARYEWSSRLVSLSRPLTTWPSRLDELPLGTLGRSYRAMLAIVEGLSLSEQLEAAGFVERRPGIYAFYHESAPELPVAMCAVVDDGNSLELMYPYRLVPVPGRLLGEDGGSLGREDWDEVMAREPSHIVPYGVREIVRYHTESDRAGRIYTHRGFGVRPDPHYHTANGDVLCLPWALRRAYLKRWDPQTLENEETAQIHEYFRTKTYPPEPMHPTPGDCN